MHDAKTYLTEKKMSFREKFPHAQHPFFNATIKQLLLSCTSFKAGNMASFLSRKLISGQYCIHLFQCFLEFYSIQSL